jgi:GDP/UDP-N,N'-diacetylbacillosamine 2-epimerase (hydrolysing)
MSQKKKILAITGIRSEFDIILPVLKTLRTKFEVKIVICGTHLSDWHGNTYESIEKEGFPIADRIDYLLMTNRKTQRSKGLGTLISSLTQTVEREDPQFIMYVGDREEAIASSLVGNYLDILTVHIGGGDPVYGNADDPVRFACSELSHIHFSTTQDYADNLLSLGEEPKRVVFTGNPALKNIKDTPIMSIDELENHLQVSLKKYVVLLKHPLSSEKESAYDQMKITLESLARFCKEHSYKVIGIYPNTDPVSYDIITAINEVNNDGNFSFFKTLPREVFVNIMRNSSALIGNSSMGILEAPFYKLPVINVGARQQGRLNAGNVDFVDHCQKNIIQALNKAIFDEKYRLQINNLANPYGDGSADKHIFEFLTNLDINDGSWYIKKKIFNR